MVSYVVYFSTILTAAALAGFYEVSLGKQSVNRDNQKSWMIYGVAVLVLFVLMGSREAGVGVDDIRYKHNFEVANSMPACEYYSTYTTEPGFYLMYRIVGLVFGDFRWMIALTSLITVGLFCKAIYDFRDIIPLWLVVFAYGATQYFYYFGIIRLGIATSIVAASYILIAKRRWLLYSLAVLVAALFHYSALFALILVLLIPNEHDVVDERRAWLSGIVIPLCFFVIRFGLYPMLRETKYGHYLVAENLVNIKALSEVPFFLAFSFFYKKFKQKSKYNVIFYFMTYFRLLVELFAPTGIGRVIWYLSLAQIMLMCQVPQLITNKLVRRLLNGAIIVYCLIYSVHAYFGVSFRAQYMLPYRSIFF